MELVSLLICFWVVPEILSLSLTVPKCCWFVKCWKRCMSQDGGAVVVKELISIEAKRILLNAQLSEEEITFLSD